MRGRLSNLGATLQARTVALGTVVGLGDIAGIDISNVSDGAVLIYNGALRKFIAQTIVENNNTRIVGGSF